MAIAVKANVNTKKGKVHFEGKFNGPSEKKLKKYAEKLGIKNIISRKTEFPGCDELDYLIKIDHLNAVRRQYILRFHQGHMVACHVFAHKSGKEPLYGKNWLNEYKACANAICKAMGSEIMYEDCMIERTLSDYEVSHHKNRPIVTDDVLALAAHAYPLEDIKLLEDKLMAAEKPEEPKEEFDDSDVEVMDVEENIINASEKFKKGKKAKKPEPEVVDGEIISEETVEEPKPEEKKASEPKSTKKEDKPKSDKEAKPEEKKPEKEEPEKVVQFSVVEDKKDDKIQAISFDPEKMVLFPNDNLRDITPKQKELIEKSFGQYLKGHNYQLNRIKSGIVECVFNDKGVISVFYIDPGMAIGNGYNVLGNYATGNPVMPLDTIPVHWTEKDICKKVFADKAYILTPEEVQKCMSHMFKNQRIYNVVDMSNMYNRLKKMSEEEFRKLGQKLTFVINCLPVDKIGRMRINEWKSVDSFKMISDEKCKSPFPGQTRDNVTGVKVAVDGDNVTVELDSNTKKQYTIEEYNVL